MEQQLSWIYAFNIVVNSALSFFTTILLIEFFMFLFRIKHPRIKAMCRPLPFFKICLDLCLYHFSNWALLHGVNPILAEKGSRKLSVMLNPFTGIEFSMQDKTTFSVADLIALSIDPLWIQGAFFVAIIGGIIAISRYLILLLRENQHVSRIVHESRPLLFQSMNESLMSWMKKKQVMLAVSTAVTSPCIAGKTILFPADLIDDLSQEELGAVIAHEIAHLHWKDCSLRIVCALVASVFWWIPSGWWRRRIEEMQEQASDAMIHRFGISNSALAEAVLKTAQKAKEMRSVLVFPFVGRRLWIKRRMEAIFQEPTKPIQWRAIRYWLLICSLISILFGKLWIF